MVLSDDPEGNRAVLRALSDIASERKANLERIFFALGNCLQR